jgi:hypothetical protein
MATWIATIIATSSVLATAACGQTSVPVVYRSSSYTFSIQERHAIQSIASRSADEVRKLLPGLPAQFQLFVDTSDRVIPETGESGSAMPSGVYWTVDPRHDGGVMAVVNAQVRPTLYHELYHMVREAAVPTRSLRDLAIDEGLATVFERDAGHGTVPWGTYPQEVSAWTTEFLALPPDADRQQWMIRHPDGRRWIGYKVGTYLADRAARKRREPVTALATVQTEQIIAWALE